MSEVLFYGGIAIMVCSAVGGIVAGVLLRVSGKRLRGIQDKEFGKKRHG